MSSTETGISLLLYGIRNSLVLSEGLAWQLWRGTSDMMRCGRVRLGLVRQLGSATVWLGEVWIGRIRDGEERMGADWLGVERQHGVR